MLNATASYQVTFNIAENLYIPDLQPRGPFYKAFYFYNSS
jgi:hypothetical protein